MNVEIVDIEILIPDPDNARTHDDRNLDAIRGSIKQFDVVEPLIVRKSNNVVIGGNGRLQVLKQLGYKQVPVNYVEFDDQKSKALALTLNRTAELAAWDDDRLAGQLQELYEDGYAIADIGFDLGEFGVENDKAGGGSDVSVKGMLAKKFVVPPFSVLDTRQGYWLERKREWMGHIGDNGESRSNTLQGITAIEQFSNFDKSGVSILDPVLAEAMCKWFTPKDGSKILDPFAGDTVFGYVAKALGHDFTGIELRKEQCELNQARCDTITDGGKAKYINDDSFNMDDHVEDGEFDFVFSCPPYYDLEVYSDLPNDLSNQESYADFLELIRRILTKATYKLKDNRFCCITICEIRDKDGSYCGLVPDITKIMEQAGLQFYNELVLVNSIGTAHMRASKYMRNRKMAKVHQNVLVYYKGDMKKIPDIYPEITVEVEQEA